MSLAVLADHMASKGRGPDSMLIHMSPREVQGLQALAENHGGSLTINPETGLPEAGFLDKLLPTIIGAGLTFMGVPPNMSAMIVGGIQTVRTGDLGKGIQAGLGAYGGANLTAGMGVTGGEAVGSAAAADTYAGLGANAITDTEAIAQGFGSAEELMQSKAALAGQEATAAATPFEKLSAGASKAADNPMAYLKANAKPLMYAAGPAILAAASAKENMPKTVTQPGMIRPYSYNPYSGGFVGGNPYEAQMKSAANGGLMGLAAGGMAGYGDGDDVPRRTIDGMAQGGMYDFAQRSEPVVRMASGGIPGFAGDKFSFVKDASGMAQADINAALATELGARGGSSLADIREYAKTGYKLSDAQINAALDTIPGFNAQGTYDANDYMATHKAGVPDYQVTVDAAAAANPFSAQNMAKVDTTRPGHYVNDASGNPVALTNYSPGFDINNPTALTYLGELSANPTKSDAATWFQQNATPAQKAESARLYGIEKARLDALDASKGLTAINQNIVDKSLTNQNLINQNKNQNADAGLAALDAGKSSTYKWFEERGLGFTPIDKVIDNWFDEYTDDLALLPPDRQEKVMKDALNTENMNEADLIKATGKTIKDWIQYKTRNDGTKIVSGRLDEVPVDSLPGGVSGAGSTVVNPNGTITTKPDFGLTMNDVRDTYTKGGGSLGYTSPTFDSLKAVEDKYPLTGGSKQSYDYLMGRKDYDPVPFTKTGEVMKPYAESVLGMKLPTSSKMYLFDPATKQYKINPDYAIPTYDSKGVKSTNLTNKDVTAYMDKNPSQADFYTWATTNNLSVEQIAAATGRPISEISKLYTGAKALTGEDGKIDQTKVDEKAAADEKTNFDHVAYLKANPDVQAELDAGKANFGTKEDLAAAAYEHYQRYGKMQNRPYTKKAREGGLMAMARGGMAQQFNLGDYSDGGRLLRGPGDGVSDSIPASIGNKRPARLADGEFVVPARIVSELGNGSTEAGARKLYAMMDRVQAARRGTVGRGRVAKNSRADKYLPA
jgi:hypothetical protein